jgi:hypothetical protein
MMLTEPIARRSAIAVLGTLDQEQSLAPGESFEGSILLKNTGASPASARLFQADYNSSAHGADSYGSPSTRPRSNAGWLSVGATALAIPPGETATVPYHGRVPATPGLEGSYWSMIMVENTDPQATRPSGIRTVARYGIQIITNIGETGRRSVRFIRREFIRNHAATYALLDLENDGDRLIFPRAWIEVYDATGAKRGRFGGESLRLYPGGSARYRVELPGLPKGAYNALLLADCGHDQVVGTRVAFTL